MGMSKIIKRVGLIPLAQPHKKVRTVTSPYKKECLERAIEIELPATDIAYFLHLPPYVVDQFFYIHYKGDKKRPQVERSIKRYGKTKDKVLHY